MNVKRLKMYEYYYNVSESSEVQYKLNRFDKIDLFNIMTQNVFDTEEEAKVGMLRQIDILDRARDMVDQNGFAERFVRWLMK